MINTLFEDRSNRSSKPLSNKFQLFTSNQLSKYFPKFQDNLETSMGVSSKNRNNISLKNTNDFFETKTSLTSRTTTYSSKNFNSRKREDNFDSKYNNLLNHVLEKRKTDDFYKHTEFFIKDNGKEDFVSKFNEIKTGINKVTKKFSQNTSLNSQSTSFSRLNTNSENSNFLKGNATKQMFIKKNVESLFPKKKETVFACFKSASSICDNKLTLNSSILLTYFRKSSS